MGSSSYAAGMVVMVLLVVMLPKTASFQINWLCNGQSFGQDDPRRLCVDLLMRQLLGDPVMAGRWYTEQDCVDNLWVYGFRWADQGATGCLFEASDALQFTQCNGRLGGQAWGDGCYMRFEIYPFDGRQ